jgi:predicted metal-dependent phosphoesterase TrpH
MFILRASRKLVKSFFSAARFCFPGRGELGRMGSVEPAAELEGVADLHTHSHYSDGVLAPAALVQAAGQAGLKALALTDHDTVQGLAEFVTEGMRQGVIAIPGVELSTLVQDLEVHILGYGCNPENPELLAALARFAAARRTRIEKMVANLRELGLKIALQQVLAVAGKGPLGRPHLAEALVRAGLVKDFDEAFAVWIGRRSRAYVEKYRLLPEEAVALIHGAGGLAVIAHPLIGRMSFDGIVKLLEIGIDGLEIKHPKLLPERGEQLRRLAEERGLLLSGGSDFHGGLRSEAPIGQSVVPFAYAEAILKALADR